MKDLGNRIRLARVGNHITQNQLAEICGSSAAVISNWESDRNEPSCDMLVKLASGLEVSFDYLLDYQDPHKEKTLTRRQKNS